MYLALRIPFPKTSTLALVRCVAQKILQQHGGCYVSRGVDATFLGTHERDDRCHTSSFGQGHQRQSHTMLVTHTHSPVATETGSAIPAAAPAYGLQHQAGF